jgi:hypothetical protein
MRALTEAEGRVIAVLLGSAPTNERERLRRVDVPRSTYHAARRRAYQEAWLKDRYVPDPARFGYPWVNLVVVRPFADRVQELGKLWAAHPTNVVAWVGAQSALGVFFHATARDAAQLISEVGELRLASRVTAVTAHVTSPDIPVYFDYEGLWTHLAGIPGAASYPNGLGGTPGDTNGETRSVTPHQRWGAAELVHRPFVAQSQGREGHLVGPFGLPFSQQKLLRSGWVSHRVFLEPSLLPPYKGRSADQVVFISGTLREGTRPEVLFASLTRDCRVFPFLYAASGGRLLLAALGRSAVSPGPEPTGSPVEGPRGSVMATLQSAMEGIEVVQEAANQFRILVDHRYDRVLPK